MITLVDQKTRYANVQMETQLDADLPPIWVSATELQQVLLNLLNNSVDAMDSSGGNIHISTQLSDGHITLKIADNGMGIAEANLARIFDPFYTTKPVGQGTGLGLSICYGIIKKLGETSRRKAPKARVQHLPFPCRWPKTNSAVLTLLTNRSQSRNKAVIQTLKEEYLMAYRSSTLVPPSVLLVDDEASFVETLSKRIAKRDLKVSTAFSGPEALEKLKAGGGASNFDVVILDVKMPGMDGLETLAAIKLKHPNVEVIMLTGHATVESAIEGMKAGAFDYLMKPCDIDLLLAKIDRAVVKKREHEEKILQAKAQMIALKRGF